MSIPKVPTNPTTTVTENRVTEAQRIVVADLESTRRFAAALAALLRPGDVVALSGELGSGKTELVRAMIRALAGSDVEVPSPSFALVQHYALPGLELWHADLYRLSTPGEVAELGLEEAVERGAVVVEWPERAAGELPADRLDLRLSFAPHLGENARILELRAGPSWRERLAVLVERAGA